MCLDRHNGPRLDARISDDLAIADSTPNPTDRNCLSSFGGVIEFNSTTKNSSWELNAKSNCRSSFRGNRGTNPVFLAALASRLTVRL